MKTKLMSASLRLIFIVLFVLLVSGKSLFAQTPGEQYVRLDAEQAAPLLIDHQ